MRFFLEHATDRSLFLIDEFGSGTDPGLGGAVAEAILDALLRSRAHGVVTTHYSNLKVYAEEKDGVENGSMVFDEAELRPLFQLETGKPGSSYTFEIARKIRLPRKVIQQAEKLVDRKNLEFENLLSKVQGDEQELASQVLNLQKKEEELKRQIEDYEAARKRILDRDRKVQLETAERRADKLAAYDRDIEEMMRILKEQKKKAQINEEAVQKVRRKVRSQNDSLRGEMKRLKKSLDYQQSDKPIEIGSTVKLMDGKQVGEVLEIRKKVAVVAFGRLRTTVKKDDLVRVEAPAAKPKSPKASLPKAEGGPAPKELDLRGKTREEAYEELDRFMNQVMMSDAYQVRIIHGKGTGALRDLVRQVLREYPVKSARHEDRQLGGDGVTVVEMS
jgi:DNA mismatch repair protein MutS2